MQRQFQSKFKGVTLMLAFSFLLFTAINCIAAKVTVYNHSGKLISCLVDGKNYTIQNSKIREFNVTDEISVSTTKVSDIASMGFCNDGKIQFIHINMCQFGLPFGFCHGSNSGWDIVVVLYPPNYSQI